MPEACAHLDQAQASTAQRFQHDRIGILAAKNSPPGLVPQRNRQTAATRPASDDPRNAALDPADLPASERLRDCQRSVLPYWHDVTVPRLRAGRRLLIISHGNTLRGRVMHPDGLSKEAIAQVEIASGVPLVYRFSEELAVVGRVWLGMPRV